MAGGSEVARWLAMRARPRLGMAPIAPGLALVCCDAPIYRDFEDALGLPTLGDATVEFRLGPPLLDLLELYPTMGAADLAAIALVRADDALEGLLSRADRLNVEVEL